MSLNELPVELVEMIFNQLPLVDRIRCRSVNKKWRFIVDNLRTKSLVLFTSKLTVIPRWPFTTEPVKLNNLLIREDFSLCLEIVLRLKIFDYLEKLYLSSEVFMAPSEVEKCLNRLVRLKELSVNIASSGVVSPSCKLSLPSLEILEIFLDGNTDCDLILDTPNLTKIHARSDFTKFSFIYPEKIKFFKTYANFEDRSFSQFTNLESVSLNLLISIEAGLLHSLTKLKKLSLSYCKEFDNSPFMSKSELLSFADRVKRISNSKQLEITYGGLSLNTKLSDCRYSEKSYEYINESVMCSYLKNLDYLSDTLPGERLVFESGGLDQLIDRLPRGFLKRFANLRSLSLQGAINLELEAKLTLLLDDCRYLDAVEFTSCSLSDHFYWNVLPKKCSFLNFFKITESPPMNFDFLLEFGLLRMLGIYYPAPCDLIKRLFQQLKFMMCLAFRSEFDERTGCFLTKEKSRFFLRVYAPGDYYYKFENFDDLDGLLIPHVQKV